MTVSRSIAIVGVTVAIALLVRLIRRISAKHPDGIITLFMTEFWERFSFYGMRAVLILYIVAKIRDGGLEFADARGSAIVGTYGMFVYMLAIPGGYIADQFLGAWLATLVGGVMIAMGHFTLAFHSLRFFYGGLGLIAMGTGLLKPNVSTMVGGLYGENDPRRDSGFTLFYMGINLGAFVGPLAVGYLAQGEFFKRWLASRGIDPNSSWHWGFAAAGVGMVIGLTQYLLNSKRLASVGRRPIRAGRRRSQATPAITTSSLSTELEGAHASIPEANPAQAPQPDYSVPPKAGPPGGSRDAGSPARRIAVCVSLILVICGLPAFGHGLYRGNALEEVGGALLVAAGAVWAYSLFVRVLKAPDWKRAGVIAILFLFAFLFWTGYEQAATTFSLFAAYLTKNEILGFQFPASWYQTCQALFVIILAPVFSVIWLKLGKREPSSPAKFTLGLFFLGLSFLLFVPASQLARTGLVSPFWLVGLYFIQVLGEMCLSPVGLSTVTKLAHVKIVGIMMGVWFLSISLGDRMAGYLGGFFDAKNPDALVRLFAYFAIVVLGAALILALMTPKIRKMMGGIH